MYSIKNKIINRFNNVFSTSAKINISSTIFYYKAESTKKPDLIQFQL